MQRCFSIVHCNSPFDHPDVKLAAVLSSSTILFVKMMDKLKYDLIVFEIMFFYYCCSIILLFRNETLYQNLDFFATFPNIYCHN